MGVKAAVNQSLIKLQTSLAFGLFGDSLDRQRTRTPLQDIVSEMIVLSHPSIRKHPHIVTLEGTCWDVLGNHQVWPVLVFEKSSLGDLNHFMQSQKGQTLPIEQRLMLCVDIAVVVRDMHANS
jgi:hypothetical protein